MKRSVLPGSKPSKWIEILRRVTGPIEMCPYVCSLVEVEGGSSPDSGSMAARSLLSQENAAFNLPASS